jgi:thiol-disulfide isomerase/thioredoxin
MYMDEMPAELPDQEDVTYLRSCIPDFDPNNFDAIYRLYAEVKELVRDFEATRDRPRRPAGRPPRARGRSGPPDRQEVHMAHGKKYIEAAKLGLDWAAPDYPRLHFMGKPTLISFFFSTCVPCILEVEPINHFAATRPQMNFLAMTFDDPAEARAFVKRYGLRWRVVPDAREFIERMRVKQYPLMALFDANGRLLGTKMGGARDALEAANVEPQLKRWIDGLLKN